MAIRYNLNHHLVFFLLTITTTLIWGMEVDLDKLKSQIPENLLPTGLNPSSVNVDDAKNLLREKCRKQSGGDEAFENLEKGVQTLIQCATGLVNASAIQSEIEKARPIGELDAVFHKYCEKRPAAITCVENFVKIVEPCLSNDEKSLSNLGVRVIKSLLSFVCYKGGDHIALFIAEGGPECLTEKREPITNCLNKTLSSYIPKEMPSIDNLPEFEFGPKQCKELTDIKVCVVDALETCKEVTPANIVESMFRYIIKNETDCEKKRK